MGYSTDFDGRLNINKPVDAETEKVLVGLNTTRRIKRNVDEALYGVEGEFYFEGKGCFGQDEEENVIDYNCPPRTQPNLWCAWCLAGDNQGIVWDGGEKFYDYVEWLQYIRDSILTPRGYTLESGNIEWQGEEMGDRGLITAKDNKIFVQYGVGSYGEKNAI